MADQGAQQRKQLTKRVADGAMSLEALTRRLRRTNAGLLISGVFTSAISTLITGVTAAQGPLIGTGTEGWRMACTAAAVFSFGATVLIGLNERLKINEKLADSRQCAGRLRALQVALTTNTRGWEEIAQEYEDIVRTYPELIT